MSRTIAVISGLLFSFAAAAVSAADAAYPTKAIRLIIPFAPGGPSDVLARMVGQKLSERVGQQVVPDNRPSVGAIIGAELTAKSPPDGYTLLLSANSLLTINPYVYKKLPYDPQKDLQPITQLTEGGNVIVVHPSVPVKNIKGLISLAKAKPGEITYATTGTGPLLATANFKKMAGIDMLAVPYKGTGQAVIDLVAGHIHMFFMSPLVAITNVKAGKLRALAVTSMKRNRGLPDVPTVDESGLPGFKYITWHSIMAPGGTPQPIVQRLSGEIAKIVHLPDVQQRLHQQGLEAVGSTPEELGKHIQEESVIFAQLVKAIGYQPQ